MSSNEDGWKLANWVVRMAIRGDFRKRKIKHVSERRSSPVGRARPLAEYVPTGKNAARSGRQKSTHPGQMTFSEAVNQLNPVFANRTAHERPLATSPNRPKAAVRQRKTVRRQCANE